MARVNADETSGKRLRRLRKERGITQKELAGRLGVTQPLVSGWERGTLRLHERMLVEVAQLFLVSVDEILGLEKTNITTARPAHRRWSRRLQAIDSLPKRDQEALLRTIDAFVAKAS